MTTRAAWALSLLVVGCVGCTRASSATTAADAPPDALPALPPAGDVRPFAKDDKTAVAAALKEKGIEVGDDACFAWPESFPRVVTVGAFAHDEGCRGVGLFIDRTWREVDAEVDGLASRGWATANASERRAVARAWVVEVAQAFGGRFITASEPAFDASGSPKYVPVTVVDHDGVIEVKGWVRQPPGMNDETAYAKLAYRFDAGGKVKIEHEDDFAVPGEVLRAMEAKAKK